MESRTTTIRTCTSCFHFPGSLLVPISWSCLGGSSSVLEWDSVSSSHGFLSALASLGVASHSPGHAAAEVICSCSQCASGSRLWRHHARLFGPEYDSAAIGTYAAHV